MVSGVITQEDCQKETSDSTEDFEQITDELRGLQMTVSEEGYSLMFPEHIKTQLSNPTNHWPVTCIQLPDIN